MVMPKPEGESGVKPEKIFKIAVQFLDIRKAHKKHKICNDKNVIIQSTKSIECILNFKARLQKNKENSKSLSDFKILKAMKGKISKAGINETILQEAFKTGGLGGLTILLGENVNNKPRVTTNTKIIKSIFVQLNE